jgi:uncharacterized LabA/DUF88 family protein
VRKKPLKRIRSVDGDQEIVHEKGNMDVEIAIDAVNTVAKYDLAVLFTGDSDFLALVRYIRGHGKKVYAYSSRNNVSTEIRTGTDGYTDILNIQNNIWGRNMKYRNQTNK